MGPHHFSPSTGINVRPHPHINLATVTYTFEGEIWHRDSVGSDRVITPGAVNLMVAGSGIVHSERTKPNVYQSGQKLNGLQLWLALPEKDEEVSPSFHHYQANEIPEVQVGGVSVRVIMGEAYGICSPVKTFAQTLYIELVLNKDQKLVLPQIEEYGVYVVEGSLMINGQKVSFYEMAVLNSDKKIEVQALENKTILVVIGGEKLSKRFIEWNFVSSDRERIKKAKQDWEQGLFPTIPGDEEEYIPLPKS
tara:strand:- start:22764 stop:23513 length:750 start_codon:yes stop_codon:yes gene_type:complete